MFQHISSAVSGWIASFPEGENPPVQVWAAVLAYNTAAAMNADDRALKRNNLNVNRMLLTRRWDAARMWCN